MDLITIVCEGAMKATALHAHDQGLTLDHEVVARRLREVVKRDFGELLEALKDATEAHMGDATYRNVINTYCNAWAVEVLRRTECAP